MADKKHNETLSNAATESVIKCKKIRELLTPDSEKRDLILPKFDMIEEYSKFIQSSEFIVPSVRIFEALEILFDFPNKLLQNEKLIVVSARLKLISGHAEKIRQVTNENLTHRLRTQPYQAQTCGSVFRNPEPLKAAEVYTSSPVGTTNLNETSE